MSAANPNKIDYNKDTRVDQYDDELARMDKNKDGFVTSKEKQQYKQKQGETVTEFKYDAQGNVVEQKTKSSAPATEPALTAEGYGFSEQFLSQHDDVRKAIQLAIENEWPQDVLNRYIEENTEFGQSTTDAQSAFDIQINSGKSEDLQRQIDDQYKNLKKQVLMSGVDISDEELKTFARESIRSGLTENDTLAFISERFRLPTSAAGQPAQSAQGQAAVIIDSIKNMARSYGVTLTDSDLQAKAREAMNMGSNWQSWLEGQRNIFRQQAKTLYPTVANLLDQSDLSTIMNPYMSDAAELLGISPSNMRVDDPMWQIALNGPNGPMSRDEWIRVLRTDTRFGYDRTVRARQEYADLGDELLSAFGMA